MTQEDAPQSAGLYRTITGVSQRQSGGRWIVEIFGERAAADMDTSLEVTVAVSAQQAADQAGLVIMVDHHRGSEPACPTSIAELAGEQTGEAAALILRVVVGRPPLAGLPCRAPPCWRNVERLRGGAGQGHCPVDLTGLLLPGPLLLGSILSWRVKLELRSIAPPLEEFAVGRRFPRITVEGGPFGADQAISDL